jgi:hypothetical protein
MTEHGHFANTAQTHLPNTKHVFLVDFGTPRPLPQPKLTARANANQSSMLHWHV